MRRNRAKTILMKTNFAFWFLLYLVIYNNTHDIPNTPPAHFSFHQTPLNERDALLVKNRMANPKTEPEGPLPKLRRVTCSLKSRYEQDHP